MNVAIIGANFGDEGKGHITDYVVSKCQNPIVVRFNGGAQAGHTVVTPEGKRHVFSHFSSGTFCDAPTYLDKNFVINPILFRKEAKELKKLPKVFVHPNCYITLPWDMLINQFSEKKLKHGSCGIGFNETIERNINGASLTIRDVYGVQNLQTKVERFMDYYMKRILQLDLWEEVMEKNSLFTNQIMIKNYLSDLVFFLKTIEMKDLDYLKQYEDIVFEGAQGLGLDQNSRYFPHVTRSNTGIKNISVICKELNLKDLETIYVTRCYMTRHGNGPFPTEIDKEPFQGIKETTNVYHEYQGRFRYGLLDILELVANITQDNGPNSSIAMNCLDQVGNEVRFVFNGEQKLNINDFVSYIEDFSGISIKYISYGARRDEIWIKD